MLNTQLIRLIATLIIALGIWPLSIDDSTPLNGVTVDKLKQMEVPEEGFTFVVWGDCRDDKGRFDDVIKVINDLSPIFTVGLGDYVSNGTRREYDVFLKRIEALNPPLISVIGNHDTPGDGRKIWLKEFGGTNFFFDFGGIRFICLDNADYKLDVDELQMLGWALQVDTPRVVFAHCPPDYDVWSAHCFKRGSDAFLALLDEYKVEYAFFAHIHLYSELMIGETQAVVTGGAGAPLYKGFNFGGPNIHVVKVTVTPEGISHEYVQVYR